MQKALRLATVAVVLFSARAFGQQHRVGFIPAEQQSVSVPDDDFGERIHSTFDQQERTLAKNALPDQSLRESSSGTVSVDEARHPLSVKGERLINTGQKFAKAADHEKAIDEFKQALNEPTAKPYARALLGSEYLKTGDPSAATGELSEAVRLMPGVAANHSNLGYAYLLTGKREAAEHELREAIQLDHTSPQPRYLLGLLLLDRGTQEAAEYLSFAQKLVNKARLAMAVFHMRHGQSAAAEQDLRDYLGPEWAAKAAAAKEWITAAADMEQPSALFGLPAGR
jgi:tetratricopeptide (TPR) repeat protein